MPNFWKQTRAGGRAESRLTEKTAGSGVIRPRAILFLGLLVALLATAGAASLQITLRTRDAIVALQEEHYPIVSALEKIRHSASRLTGAVVMQMAGREFEGYSIFHQNAEILTENLNLISSLPAAPHRDPHVRRLREQVNVLLSESERVIAQISDRSSAAMRYSQMLSPQVLEIAEIADNLLKSERAAAQTTHDRLIRQGWQAAILWWVAMALGCALAFFGWRYVEHKILAPLDALREAMAGVGEGDLEQEVRVNGDDELAFTGRAFNEMAAKLRATRKGTTEQMMRLHRTMETTLASFHNAFFVLGKDRNIELRNPAADKLAVKLFLEGQAKLPPVIYEHIDRVLETRQNYLPAKVQDALQLRIDNEEKFFLPQVLLLLDERGDTFGVAVVLEDVTHQRLLDDVKTNLLSTVSHELRTPLTSVRMALHLLLEKAVGPLNRRQTELVATAKEDSERLLRTLNNLLDLTRLEETSPDLKKELCSVEDLVRSIVAGHDAASFTLDIENDLPPLHIDREKIDHVFSNFVTNAQKYSPSETAIILRARAVLEDQIRISVIDQGPGISRDHQERIFDKFYRVPGQQTNGAGLGLSIAREIALLHKGNVGVISELGQGSEFFIDLPAVRHTAVSEPGPKMDTRKV